MTPLSTTPASITENPWFWLMLFSAAAMLAVTLIAPKYAARQARAQRMAGTRDVIAAARSAGAQPADVRRVDPNAPVTSAQANGDGANAEPAVAPPIVPYLNDDFKQPPKLLWLYALLTTMMVVGATGLQVSRGRARKLAATAAASGSSTLPHGAVPS